MTKTRLFVFTAIAMLGLLLAACAQATPEPAVESPDVAIPELAFSVQEFEFTGPDTATAGWTRINLTNNGQGGHHLQLLKIEGQHSLDELKAALEADPERFPEWAVAYGGPNAPDPGNTTSAIVKLDAGTYAIISVIPGADGVPGFVNGLMKSFMVTAASGAVAAEPQADVSIGFNDFVFDVSGEFRAGDLVLGFENHGTQPHEMYLVKLNEGVTADDYLNAPLDAPPPATGLGGVTGIDSGMRQYVDLSLEPGNYAMFCFFPDAITHAPHFALGMLTEFTVDSEAVGIVKAYYAAVNAGDIDAAMAFVAEDAVFANPTGYYEGAMEIRGGLVTGVIRPGITFELSNFREDNGRIVYDYAVRQGDSVLERGSDGLTIVENGLIVFDGTERSEP